MKKKLCTLIVLIFSINLFSQTLIIEKYIENKFIPFSIVDKYENSLGELIFDNGFINCSGVGIISCTLEEVNYLYDFVEIYFCLSAITNYNEGDRLKIRKWSYPKKFKVIISNLDIQDVFEKDIVGCILVDTSQTYPTTCQAIVIDNLNIRDKPSLCGNKIGIIQKGVEVTLYEESKNQEEIDGEKNFWYKVKVDEETYGWVYGAYVRIFFEDPSLGYSDKERILESLETL